MKVIRKDNLDRDFQPEKLITVDITETEGNLIVKALNSASDDYFYKLEPNSYALRTESIYECNGDVPPESFINNLYGLNAILKDPRFKYHELRLL